MTRDRILGIDLGSRRVGVAIAEAGGRIALPLEVIDIRDRDWVGRVIEIVEEEDVSQVVLGLPTRLDGTEGPEAAAARETARSLEKRLGLPVALVDERLTTAAATRAQREVGVREREGRRSVDRIAAAMILQVYLDSVSD